MSQNGHHNGEQREIAGLANPAEPDDRGWYPLNRSIMDELVWADSHLLKVYLWCLLRASFSRRTVSVSTGRGSIPIALERGQFVFGRYAAAAELQMPAESVRTRIAKLNELGLISTAPTNHCNVVYRGHWPKTLSGANDQKLTADPSIR